MSPIEREEILDLRADVDYERQYGKPVFRGGIAWKMIRLEWAVRDSARLVADAFRRAFR